MEKIFFKLIIPVNFNYFWCFNSFKKLIYMNLKITLFIILIITSLTCLSQNPGSLDSTFGTNGKVTTDLYGYQEFYDMAIQSDGKSVHVGRARIGGSGGDYNFCVFRYNEDGTIDTTFGANGGVAIDILDAGGFDEALAVVIQPDGKIIAGGSATLSASNSDSHFALVRLNTDGSLDTTFGTNGKTTFTVGNSGPADKIYNLTLQSDGKIIAVGQARNSGTLGSFAITRLNADGTLDGEFSNDGKLTVHFNNSINTALATRIEPDGKIIVGGGDGSDLGLVRCFDDGSIDTSFGTNGKISFETSDTDFSFSLSQVAFQPDGKAIVLGKVSNDVAMCRVNVDGTLDTDFGINGRVQTDIDNSSLDDGSTGILFDSDGNIIVTALCNTGGVRYFGVLRYTNEGALDTSFSNDGIVLTNFLSGFNSATSAAFQSDGKLLVSGFAGFSFQTHSAVARYHTGVTLGVTALEDTTLKVYPNPTSNIVTIESQRSSLINNSFNVFDQLGRVVLSGKIGDQMEHQIDLSQFDSGIYYLLISDNVYRLVKQ